MRRELFSSDVCTQTQSFEFRMYLSYAVTHDPSERPSASNLAPYFGVKKCKPLRKVLDNQHNSVNIFEKGVCSRSL
jgi:hypothetical protein